MAPTLNNEAPVGGLRRQRLIAQALGVGLLSVTLVLILFETALLPGFLVAAYTQSKFPDLDDSRESPASPQPLELRQNELAHQLAELVLRPDVGAVPDDQSIKRRIRELAQDADALFEGAAATNDDAKIWRVIRSYRGPDSSKFANFQREFAEAVAHAQPATNPSDVSQPRSGGGETLATFREIDRQLDHIENLVREARRRHDSRQP